MNQLLGALREIWGTLDGDAELGRELISRAVLDEHRWEESFGLAGRHESFAAIGIKLSSKGPVFFKQMRGGKYGKPFPMLKFRTMNVETMCRMLLISVNQR